MQMLGSRHSSAASGNTSNVHLQQHGSWEQSQQLPESENNAQYSDSGGKVSAGRQIPNSSSVHRNEPTIDFDDDIPF